MGEIKTLEFNHEDGYSTPEQGKLIDELLKEKDIKFDSNMVWDRFYNNHIVTPRKINPSGISAYSSAELGFLLPTNILHEGLELYYWAESEIDYLNKSFFKNGYGRTTLFADNRIEAQARAALLIKGLTEGWINKKNIGT